MGTVDGMGSVSGVRGWSSLQGWQVAICSAFQSSQRTANWKSQHLEHQAAGGNGQKQVHAEEEYSAGHVSSLHSVSKPAEQERKTSPAQNTGYVRRRQGQHHPLSMMTSIIYGIATALAACPSAGGLRQCVCCFVLLNRYWGIVTVPGSFLKAGDLGWPDPHPAP